MELVHINNKNNFYSLIAAKKKPEGTGTSKEKDRSIDEKLHSSFNKTYSAHKVTQNLPHEPKSLKITEQTVMSTVLVENFPSRQELMEMVNKFVDEKKYPKDYKSKNKGSSVEFLFSNIVIFKYIQLI